MRGRTQQVIGALLGLMVLLGGAGPAAAAKAGQVSAQEGKMCPICAKAGDDMATYPSKAGSTLVRGAANTLLGWTELIRQPVQETKAGGNVFTGLAKGLGEGVKRTLGGAGEVLTFWTPKVKGSYLAFAHDCPLCMNK